MGFRSICYKSLWDFERFLWDLKIICDFEGLLWDLIIMLPTDCSALRALTILPNIRISWD